jgi:hypothetical protein
MEEETHRKLETLAEGLMNTDKKRVKKAKGKLEVPTVPEDPDYAICLKYNQLSN